MAIYSGFTMIYPLKIVIFHSYVSLPEGNCCCHDNGEFGDGLLLGFSAWSLKSSYPLICHIFVCKLALKTMRLVSVVNVWWTGSMGKAGPARDSIVVAQASKEWKTDGKEARRKERTNERNKEITRKESRPNNNHVTFWQKWMVLGILWGYLNVVNPMTNVFWRKPGGRLGWSYYYERSESKGSGGRSCKRWANGYVLRVMYRVAIQWRWGIDSPLVRLLGVVNKACRRWDDWDVEAS